MSYRRKAAKPRLALWMLVALGDLVLLLVAAGVPAMVALLGVLTVTGLAVGGWRLGRRVDLAREGTVASPVRVPVVNRRRA
ncbi:hypothetical protein V6V47_19945 [Micromonospora sp. CPCC 205539]|uniref:hypothetical protein n=1 Tax=Micromonospora sp. CPCC 205539 TaxID=3122408 RepID=UPI002FF2AC1A